MRRYDVVVTRGSSLDYLKSDTPRLGGNFGVSLSLSGDTLAIGAPSEDVNGAVYVFTRADSVWTEQARLTPASFGAPAGFFADAFGSLVSLSGDTLAISAFGDDSSETGVDGSALDHGAPDSGAVYVFKRSGTAWTQEAYLKASNTDAVDFFGSSISLSSDTLAVGAYQEDSAATGVDGDEGNALDGRESGAAYVFVRENGRWIQQAYLKPADLAVDDFFGWSVSLSGDTLAVGAIGEDSEGAEDNRNAQASGAVYIFERSQGTWQQKARLKAARPHQGDRFGNSLSFSGNSLAIGANFDDANAAGGYSDVVDDRIQDSGAVYVFVRSGGAWTQQAFLKASNAGAEDGFGNAVSLSGDILAVGADMESSISIGLSGHQADDSAFHSGAVYLFTRSGSSWVQRCYVKAPNTGAGDRFGVDISLDGDALAVGAFGESSSAVGVNGDEDNDDVPASGAVYIYK
jgi:hypothetical protein